MAKPAAIVGGPQPYSAYKPSGVKWLGEVPAHWEVLKLGQMGTLSKGNGGSKADEVPVGVPCVRYGDLYTTHSWFVRSSRAFVSVARATDYTRLKHGDVLFAASGETLDEIGKSAVNLMLSKACCGGDIIVFRPKYRTHAPFMGYVTDCWSSAIQKATMGKGFTVVHIYATQLKHLVLPVPPLPEQAAIASYLDHADRRVRRCIRGKQKLITLLEEQKQAIIHQAVTGRIDVQASKPYPSYRNSGVTWLGKVPEHWKVIRLGRLITLTTGFPFKSEGFTESEGDVRLLRGINVAPGRLRWEEIVRWPAVDTERFAEYELQPADIVLGMDRPIVQGGIRVAVVGPADVPSLLLQRVARIRPGKELIRGFAVLILNGRGFSDYLAPILTGVSVPHLSPEQIKGFRFALPSLAEQGQILEWLSPRIAAIRSAMNLAMSEVLLLREYRARLISDVVTGKLDVREAALRLPNELEEPEPLAESGESAGIYAETSDELDALTQESEI